ncbi:MULTISPECIES: FMN-binding glutamate synthase family protein [unclassified Modicisalibacter]|uniref:FMN-binding glutamate synthase family protein n=1 Tax=unclassified Modicisalibacter TaxID=2679913 RepID=UPI001CCD1E00|nr:MULTISPECIES: FMN-binding glutamate synthase family protein [unclassified Modicisalibacter]MBZ9560368.1 FMN-binding glutamate synthase family protein [Modicisalibacter sp. R2A 31.J]MBZ9576277.1 FMN-binding glutamate synthase family protein [Modicisalibacter sp. MOD 31.J]
MHQPSLLSRLPFRYAPYIASLIGLVVSLGLWPVASGWGWAAAIFAALAALGTYDIRQKSHTVSRNYPILAHFRYGLESIGPEIRQYFIESDTDAQPFSREQRSLVYRRAKNVSDKKAFGSVLDLYAEGYEWMSPSLHPATIDDHDFRLVIGADCDKPYSASVFNISAMSFGALSPNAISALNRGARDGGFYHDTGEGAISPYHRHGGDLVWEIGSGYFGCRNDDGSFSESRFVENATLESVKMIEIKLSQGAKPGHGGILPAAKVTPEIAATRGVSMGRDVVSPAGHSAFTTPLEMMAFIARLRHLSGGKPVGIKLAIGHPWEWFGLVKAMLESDTRPDFIVVDGGEGGTGAAPLEFINRLGMPLTEALLLVHNTLVGAGLRERIHVGASGKIISAFDIARTIALGADWCNAARGFMFSLGCIQSMSCHTDRCPSGVATQDPQRGRKLDVADKSQRVRQFHENTLEALAEMLAAAGLTHPGQLGPEHVLRRASPTEVQTLDTLYAYLAPGELLEGTPTHQVYRHFWDSARADAFRPPEEELERRQTKLR